MTLDSGLLFWTTLCVGPYTLLYSEGVHWFAANHYE